MDKVINFMNENNNIVIDGKLVFELEQELKRLKEENEQLAIRVANLNERFINGFNYNECRYKQALQEIREYCEEQNLKADYTACEVIRRIEEVIGVE